MNNRSFKKSFKNGFAMCVAVAASMLGMSAYATWTYDSSAGTLSNDTGYSFTVAEVTLTDPETKAEVPGFEITTTAPSTATGDLDFTNVATETGTGKNVISFNLVNANGASLVGDVSTCYKVTAPHVINICRQIFNGNKVIKEVVLSEKVTAFPAQCFNGTTSLTNLTPRTFPYVTTLFDKVHNSLLHNQFNSSGIVGELNFPNVTNVGTKAFWKTKITGVSLPRVEEIGEGAFEGCTSLTGDLYFAELKKTGSYPFKGCSLITSFTAPKMETVSDSVLQNCSALTNVSFGAACGGNYGNNAFASCSKLVSLTPWPNFSNITNTYDNKGNIYFYYNPIKGCSSLVGSIELSGPLGLHTIMNDWMDGCNGITSITIRTPWVTNVVNHAARNLAPGATIYWNTDKAPLAFGTTVFASKDADNRARIIVKNDLDGWKALSCFTDASTLSAKDSTNRADWPGKKTFGVLQSHTWLVDGSVKGLMILIR